MSNRLQKRSGSVPAGHSIRQEWLRHIFPKPFLNDTFVVEEPDKRGRPVLLIACDGSGSLNRDQMAMLKNMACAWLMATAKSRIEILAALFHSGEYRKNRSGPLVQWMYHPQKPCDQPERCGANPCFPARQRDRSTIRCALTGIYARRSTENCQRQNHLSRPDYRLCLESVVYE